MSNEYVIGIKVSTDLPLSFKNLHEVVLEQVSNGSAIVLTAETYESWKEEQEAK
jgi:PHD/YefM family antitoxin component YafN of YafNO toxin-antitoxin module